MGKHLELNTNVECVYSTTTKKMTEPRLSYKITFPNSNSQSMNNNDHANGILQKRMHIVLCYKKQSYQDSGLHAGGWIKQSLGNALMEHPISAGRLRKTENGALEILSNDGGVRCVEARVPLSLEEFLQSKEMNNDVESKLVYWNDVDETNPLFSPLFYIQVTNFQCGGYSIGISYSLLLADPLFMANFLNNWAQIHRSMVANESEIPRTSFFHTPNYNRMSCSSLKDATSISNTTNKISKTLIFNIFTKEKLSSGDEICKYFVLLCLEEASKNKFASKTRSNFTLITKEPNGDAKVENLSKQGNFEYKNLKYELSFLSWEDLGINEIAFHKEIELVDASQWIACDALEEVVLVVISSLSEGKSSMKVYITLSSDREARI